MKKKTLTQIESSLNSNVFDVTKFTMKIHFIASHHTLFSLCVFTIFTVFQILFFIKVKYNS